jgi:ABC-type branched-subunit amino acid transport system substrate-binding protein
LRKVLAGALALLVVAACSNSKNNTTTGDGGGGSSGGKVAVNEPGVTDSTIRIGGVASVTNPLGSPYASSFDGVQAYVDMVNAQGGIYGRHIELVSKRDDKTASNDSQAQALLSQDNVFAVLPVTTLLFTGADTFARAGVPTFGWNINAEWASTPTDPKPNLFGHAGSFLCADCATPLAPYVAQQAKLHKLGVLAYSVPQSKDCSAGIFKSVAKWGGAAQLDLAYIDSSLSFGVTDLAVQVTKMKAAGVDFVITCMDTQGVVTLAKEMKKQGLKALQLLPNGYDHQFVGDYGDLFQGSYVQTYFTPFETSPKSKGLSDYLEWMKKSGKPTTENSMDAWLNAALFVEGLRKAGPNFTRQKVVDAINAMTHFTADGLLAGVDWTRGHTELVSTCVGMSKISGSGFVPTFTKDGKPFICFDPSAPTLTPTYAS